MFSFTPTSRINGAHYSHLVTNRVVIALDDSPRLESFILQPQARSFSIFSAFDGRNGAGDEYFDRERFSTRTQTQPKGGEIGCAISHYLVIKNFAEEEGLPDDLMIVAEDDSRFVKDFDSVIHNITTRLKQIEYVNMAEPYGDINRVSLLARARLPMSLKALPVGPHWPFSHRVGHAEGRQWGNSLYMISRAASRRYYSFAANEGRISWLADEYDYWAAKSGIHLQLLRPNLATWYGESTIDPDRGHGAERTPTPTTLRERLSERIAIRTRVSSTRGQFLATVRDR